MDSTTETADVTTHESFVQFDPGHDGPRVAVSGNGVGQQALSSPSTETKMMGLHVSGNRRRTSPYGRIGDPNPISV